MTVLFLYTEIADYFLKCCEALSEKAEVHIVRWPLNKEAPFDFKFSDKIKIYDKNKFSVDELKNLVHQINPALIVCSGWIDKDYLKIVKPYFKKIPTVLSCDTHWNGSLKQQLARLLSPFFILNRFSHAWVPGEIQHTYLRKLGFANSKIHKGFYCCDVNKFEEAYNNSKDLKSENFPKVFLYVGRYYDFKGITDLWEAFIQLKNEHPNDWELWCCGVGTIEPRVHPKIKHFGFVQPKDMTEIANKSGVFVLPSRFEPWGVVVQEFAVAGFPMVLSDAVGASEKYLVGNSNGYVFKKNSINDLKSALKKVTDLEDKELNLMAIKSNELGKQITPQLWSATLENIYDEFGRK